MLILYLNSYNHLPIRYFINRNLKEFKKLNKEQQKIRNNIKKNDEIVDIKKLYLKGYNAKEIAKMLGKSHSLVRKYISQNILSKYELEYRKTIS